MKRISEFFERGNVASYTLVGTAFFALLAIFGITTLPSPYNREPVADMRIEPLQNTVKLGDTFTIDIVIESNSPTNVFAGELRFDHEVLSVDSINYNTSVADLWAVRPWFDNGAGTLNFAGGTTAGGGFVGTDSLIKVTFKSLAEKDSTLSMHDPRILLHDGLGTDAILEPQIDTIVSITPTNNLATRNNVAKLTVKKDPPTTDLNGDGKQSIADISIFMMNITSDDERYDFNLDGEVNIKDLNILMSN